MSAANCSPGSFLGSVIECPARDTDVGRTFSTNLARMTRRHNDANILCLGGRTIGEWEAIDILETFLNTEYDGMFHDGSLNLIREAEEYMMNDNV